MQATLQVLNATVTLWGMIPVTMMVQRNFVTTIPRESQEKIIQTQ
jgi:hypothetical protein